MQLAEACPGRGSHGQKFRHFCKEEARTAQTTPDIEGTDKDLSMEETPDPHRAVKGMGLPVCLRVQGNL